MTANDAPIEFAGQRGVSYDIACEFEDGTVADVEMQAFNQKYDYGRRAEYQVARLEAIFLKDADNPEKKDIIDKLTSKEVGLLQAQKSLSSISSNRDLWIAQYRQDIYEADRISGLYAAEKRGEERGRNEGEAAKARSTARKLLAMGVLTREQIAKATGLSVEEIQKL